MEKQKSLISEIACLACIALCLCLIAPAKLRAQGSPISLDCGGGALVGVRGGYGTPLGVWITSITGLCSAIDWNGAWMGSLYATPNSAGSGGNFINETATCPTGYGVTSVKGTRGTYTDEIYLTCSQLGYLGHANVQAQTTLRFAYLSANGPQAYGPYTCSSDSVAKILNMHGGTWVDSVNGVGCGYPNTPAPPPPPQMSSFTLSLSGNVVGGISGTTTVKLAATYPAPIGIGLTTNVPGSVTVQQQILIPYGTLSVSIPITTKPVATNVPVTITATERTQTLTDSFTLVPPAVSTLTLAGLTVKPLTTVSATLQLTGNAPTGGFPVTVTSNNTTLATVSSPVTVPAGTNHASFSVSGANGFGCDTIKAGTQSQILGSLGTVNSLIQLNISSNTATSAVATIQIPSSGTKLSLPVVYNISSSDPTFASVPATATVDSGATTTTFNISFSGSGVCSVIRIVNRLSSTDAAAVMLLKQTSEIGALIFAYK